MGPVHPRADQLGHQGVSNWSVRRHDQRSHIQAQRRKPCIGRRAVLVIRSDAPATATGHEPHRHERKPPGHLPPADATQSRSNPRRSAAPRPVSVRHLARRSAQESLRSFTNRITAEPTVAFSPSNSYVLASSARRSWSSVGDPIGPFGVGYTRQDRPPTGSTSVANGSTPFTRTVGEPRRPTQSASSGVSTRRCVAVMSVNSSASESR